MKTNNKLSIDTLDMDLETEVTNVLNSFVEAGFDEDVVIEHLKEVVNQMEY